MSATNFNVCVIKPEGYKHSLAFMELAGLIHFSLKDLGFNSDLRFNKLGVDCRNILIGCHLFDPTLITQIPKSTIILNTEQIYLDESNWNPIIYQWAGNFELWDYSERNIAKFAEKGIHNARHFRLGFQKELVRIKPAPVQDIDVLFYGSLNDRRRKILDELKSRGYNVQVVFGVYGEERDRLIARSKVVLNLHMYNSQIFEIVRVFYLLTNSKAVVAEVNDSTSIDPLYIDGVHPASYENLVDACVEVIENNSLRAELESRAFDTIRKLPQSSFTSAVLAP